MNTHFSIFGTIPAKADSTSVPSSTVCEVFSAYIRTRVFVVDRDDTDRVTVGLLDDGGVLSCFGDPSVSASFLRRGRVAYLSAATRVALASATVVNRGPFAGHLFSSLGEFGVRHLAVEVLVGLARKAGLSRTRLGKSAVGRILGFGVRGRGFSGGVGFSRLLARSRVAKLGPRGAVTGRGVDDPMGELRFGSATVTLTRRRGRGGAPAMEELSEPQPDPQETTLEAQDLDPPPLLRARPHPSTPLSLPAAPSTNSSPAGKLSKSPSERASSFPSQGSCSTKDSLISTVTFFSSLASSTTPLSSLLFPLSFLSFKITVSLLTGSSFSISSAFCTVGTLSLTWDSTGGESQVSPAQVALSSSILRLGVTCSVTIK